MSSLSGPAGLPVTGGPSKANAFDANGNFFLGSGSIPPGSSLTSGARNFLWGSRAGGRVTSATDLIVMGNDAGFNATVGGSTDTNGSVYIGYTAGKTSVEGGNTSIGHAAGGGDALTSPNNAYATTAFGEFALSMVASSQKDTAVGSSALQKYQRGGQMLALGRSPGQWISEGSYCVLAGHAAGFFNVWGIQDIYIGNGAGVGNWAGNPPRITASVASGVMTVTAFTGGDTPLAIGMNVVSTTATGFSTNYVIQSLGTGTGGTGTYNVLPNNQDAASQTMQAGAGNQNNIVIGNSSGPGGYSDGSDILIGNSIVPASASNITVLGKGQTAAFVSGDLCQGSTPATVNNAAGQTWTAAQVRGGQITRSGAIAVSDTTPSAALLVAAIPGCEVGSTIEFDVINNNTGLLTILAGSGVTLTGTTTISTLFTRKYRARVTNATASSEAVTLYGVSTAAN